MCWSGERDPLNDVMQCERIYKKVVVAREDAKGRVCREHSCVDSDVRAVGKVEYLCNGAEVGAVPDLQTRVITENEKSTVAQSVPPGPKDGIYAGGALVHRLSQPRRYSSVVKEARRLGGRGHEWARHERWRRGCGGNGDAGRNVVADGAGERLEHGGLARKDWGTGMARAQRGVRLWLVVRLAGRLVINVVSASIAIRSCWH